MEFLLQKENGNFDIDVRILKDELDKQKFTCSYRICSLDELAAILDTGRADGFLNTTPVGTLEFVQMFLSKVHNISNMNPIEVPDMLRQDRFLKRNYSIIPREKLPESGYFFVKYVSKLKEFSYTGLMEHLRKDAGGEIKDGMYQVSEVVDIESEYRCFVHDDRLVAVNHYDGKCDVLPDMVLIKAAIGNYMREPARPKAYTIDVAVSKGRGTAILEVHPWVSIGLYGYLWGSDLPHCYHDGFRWYVEKNIEIHKFSNF